MAADKKPPVLLIVVAAVLLLGGGAFWWLDYQSRHQVIAAPVLTPDARAYLKNLGLSDVNMQANEGYMTQALIEIDGKITNKGDRVIRLVEVNCVFRDPYGQVVLRERLPIAGGKLGEFKPGDTKSFRLPFDNVPDSWSKQMPDLVIAQILFQ